MGGIAAVDISTRGPVSISANSQVINCCAIFYIVGVTVSIMEVENRPSIAY